MNTLSCVKIAYIFIYFCFLINTQKSIPFVMIFSFVIYFFLFFSHSFLHPSISLFILPSPIVFCFQVMCILSFLWWLNIFIKLSFILHSNHNFSFFLSFHCLPPHLVYPPINFSSFQKGQASHGSQRSM